MSFLNWLLPTYFPDAHTKAAQSLKPDESPREYCFPDTVGFLRFTGRLLLRGRYQYAGCYDTYDEVLEFYETDKGSYIMRCPSTNEHEVKTASSIVSVMLRHGVSHAEVARVIAQCPDLADSAYRTI